MGPVTVFSKITPKINLLGRPDTRDSFDLDDILLVAELKVFGEGSPDRQGVEPTPGLASAPAGDNCSPPPVVSAYPRKLYSRGSV